ncbi:programmed cell death protein [Trifolium repens]|nr:programmed cell death protein [Trifolium repens]
MLFVFMCPSMTCLLRDQHEQWKHNPEKLCRSVKVFRYQLPRNNPFYLSECPKYDGSDKPTGSGAALCDWCVRYCSEKHQTMSWRAGHKIACQQIKVSSPVCGPNKNGTTSLESRKVGNKRMWPKFEIIEDQSECNGDKSEDNTLASSLILRNRSDDTMNSLMDSFQGDDDKRSWAHFQERIAKAPEQALRYYRNSNSKTIWPILSGRPSKDDIAKCIYCGGSMCCEFKNEMNSLDWASIVVYACEASCEASLPYKHEYALFQLYSPSACPIA